MHRLMTAARKFTSLVSAGLQYFTSFQHRKTKQATALRQWEMPGYPPIIQWHRPRHHKNGITTTGWD